ncbi:hypothetical protein H7S55_25640 [Priestia aryabhattai]|uniref:hypothetical protein n=1 Tax=Priestia aryabhattai TaxID=412384 RepID=UPI001C8D3110|nr:hypothetical protein [Priestia aryabhattai]MBY0003528.1 hypothetical protein [Priestia aryabhattai]
MLNHLFYGMRDIRNKYEEKGVTANKVGEPIDLITAGQCNVRVDIEGLEGDASLRIMFEESEEGAKWEEIGTFPIPDAHHGILFANFKPYVRYTLVVGGTKPNLDVTIQF